MSKYLVLDFETTDRYPENAAIIEGAYLLMDENGKELQRLSERFSIPEGVTYEYGAMVVTGIYPEDLINLPTFNDSTFLQSLRELDKDESVVVVGHNIQFDLSFLKPFNVLQNKKYIDTLRLMQFSSTDEMSYALAWLKAKYKLYLTHRGNSHEALTDVIDCWNLLLMIKSVNSHMTMEDFPTLMQHTPIVSRIAFGKYKHELYEDILKKDRGYMEYMLRTVDKDEDEVTHASLAYWLAKG